MAASGPRRSLEPGDVAGAAVRVADPAFVDGRLHWLRAAADGSGRMELVAATDGAPEVRSAPGGSLRSRLFGYGAGSWCATPLGPVGVDATTQSLRRVDGAHDDVVAPRRAGAEALGDPVAVPGSTFVVVARERAGEPAERSLVAVDVASGAVTTLQGVAGRAAEPAVAPDATAVAWTQWPLGAMPWDASEVWVARLEVVGDAIACRGARRVDGGPGASAGLPTWGPDGSLAYVSEAAGFWQPWVCDDGGAVRRLCGVHAEFQRPRWTTCRWLAARDDATLACAYADREGEHVAVLSPDGRLEAVDQPCVRVDGVAAQRDAIGWVGASTDAQGLAAIAAGGSVRLVDGGAPAPGAPDPEGFELTVDGVTVAGVLWRPRGARGPAPLVVSVHPGPTGAVDRSYAPVVHLLAENGVAVASVDHSGSTAHGRAHRERLVGRYGTLDVAECVAAVRHLVATGVARRDACFARGTSAGGTTALLALAEGVLRGAAAWYPASRLDDDDAGGFEEGYLRRLVGEGGGRGPLERSAELRGSAVVIQGADDEIVRPADTAALVAALAASLDDVELVTIAGEGHGFRTDRGRAAALGAELAFYERHAVATAAPPGRYDAGTAGGSSADGRP